VVAGYQNYESVRRHRNVPSSDSTVPVTAESTPREEEEENEGEQQQQETDEGHEERKMGEPTEEPYCACNGYHPWDGEEENKHPKK
jgi:hypothetical protein